MACRVALFLAAFLILCGVPVLFPGIDLWASALFYEPGRGFFLADWLPIRFVRAAMPWLVGTIIVAGLALLARGAIRRSADWRAGALLLLALAIGPGLVVNVIFKDHWGRARPAQSAAFGGTARFTPAFVPSDQCRTNCSFPAGDPSNGFVLVAVGFLIAAPRPRRAVLAGAVALGALIGVVRIAQGGHFLSDVLASGFLVFATTWLLHRWIFSGGLEELAEGLRRPSRTLLMFLSSFVTILVAGAAAYLWIDKPLAAYFANADPGLLLFFRVVTAFGVSTGYLIGTALLGLSLAVAARRATGAALKHRLALDAWRAAFIFAAVAGSGLAGDILKPVFGRARPRLLLESGTFGFTWHGARAALWSFPSGHSITIVALAAALAIVERRYWPLYVVAALLVMASRIVLDQHYLSDVLAGAFLGGISVWATQAAFRRAGIPLSLNSP
jgi:lipid A 4'-phosphatase